MRVGKISTVKEQELAVCSFLGYSVYSNVFVFIAVCFGKDAPVTKHDELQANEIVNRTSNESTLSRSVLPSHVIVVDFVATNIVDTPTKNRNVGIAR